MGAWHEACIKRRAARVLLTLWLRSAGFKLYHSICDLPPRGPPSQPRLPFKSDLSALDWSNFGLPRVTLARHSPLFHHDGTHRIAMCRRVFGSRTLIEPHFGDAECGSFSLSSCLSVPYGLLYHHPPLPLFSLLRLRRTTLGSLYSAIDSSLQVRVGGFTINHGETRELMA